MVWEESIVLMPKSVRFAFLSATIPNAMEFAEWIAKTHRCAVILDMDEGVLFLARRSTGSQKDSRADHVLSFPIREVLDPCINESVLLYLYSTLLPAPKVES